ncbi:preprotein translocase subunit SecD [Candidatus Soleaferrea massiliensis]|uniref:preprotein translocase subunit SecD n=1 Tax=Candidatus Soleaferrea massiliensis TaxID=1470354 RepID=UPI00058DB94D|nr:SecD/SecF family protein translocase subunit [Candidatus Soleaferrea massiliensis]
MKRVGKPVFFIVLALILAFSYLSFFGVSSQVADTKQVYVKGVNDIRWGIDIRGGVDVVFTPPADTKATEEQMNAAEAVIKQRLVAQNITDHEIYTDYNNQRIIVRYPWKDEEQIQHAEDAVKELGATAELTFREGAEVDETTGAPTGTTESTIILTGADVKEATVQINTQTNEPGVSLELNDSGKDKFSEATTRLASSKGTISIWMDNTMISAPTVQTAITDGKASITGNFTVESAKALADKINGGALPFSLNVESFSTISPTLGMGARDAMILAMAIAFLLVAAYLIVFYRIPGLVASISLLAILAGSVAAVSGFLPFIPSFTLTLPGIAGIVLTIGIGADANIITAERIKEELRVGKTIDGAIDAGFSRAFSAILDGNVTVILVSIVLMGAFGPPSSIFAKILTPVFFMFGPSTAGSIYSFGYTLLVGVIMNLVFGVLCSRLMLKSLSKWGPFRKESLYRRVRNDQND